jgi:hypothetical protein
MIGRQWAGVHLPARRVRFQELFANLADLKVCAWSFYIWNGRHTFQRERAVTFEAGALIKLSALAGDGLIP